MSKDTSLIYRLTAILRDTLTPLASGDVCIEGIEEAAQALERTSSGGEFRSCQQIIEQEVFLSGPGATDGRIRRISDAASLAQAAIKDQNIRGYDDARVKRVLLAILDLPGGDDKDVVGREALIDGLIARPDVPSTEEIEQLLQTNIRIRTETGGWISPQGTKMPASLLAFTLNAARKGQGHLM
jgi:hypothetical protein